MTRDDDCLRVGILGLGLIGSSIAQSLLAPNDDSSISVFGFDADPSIENLAVNDGISWASSVPTLVDAVDIVFVCVPLDSMPAALTSVRESIENRQRPLIVTDVGSVKTEISRLGTDLFMHTAATFIAGHPMAGTEESGYSAGFEGLFEGATWVLCPGEFADSRAVVTLIGLATRMRARVSVIRPSEHDAAVARISHLPYLLAALEVLLVARSGNEGLSHRLAAGSFRDVTRVASSEPGLSSSMLTDNADEVERLIPAVADILDEFHRALDERSHSTLEDLFSTAMAHRSEYLAIRESSHVSTVRLDDSNLMKKLMEICERGGVIHSMERRDDVWSLRYQESRSPTE